MLASHATPVVHTLIRSSLKSELKRISLSITVLGASCVVPASMLRLATAS